MIPKAIIEAKKSPNLKGGKYIVCRGGAPCKREMEYGYYMGLIFS